MAPSSCRTDRSTVRRGCAERRGLQGLARQVRPLSADVDCYMALDVAHAAQLAHALQAAGCGLTWLEEMLMPDEMEAHARLARKLEAMAITAHYATGEHEYTRWPRSSSRRAWGCAADVMWMGGPTDLLASSRSPRRGGGARLRRYFGSSCAWPSPRYARRVLIMSEQADRIEANFGTMFLDEPLPSQGYITLPHDKPGFGLELNKKALACSAPSHKWRAPHAGGGCLWQIVTTSRRGCEFTSLWATHVVPAPFCVTCLTGVCIAVIVWYVCTVAACWCGRVSRVRHGLSTPEIQLDFK